MDKERPLKGIIRIYLVEKGLLILFGMMGSVALVFSLIIWLAEHNSQSANIHSFNSAVWWAFSTMTTACYGDVYPTTAIGKIVAVIFLFLSIALIAIFTAHFTAAIIRSDDAGENGKLSRKIDKLEQELAEIKELLKKPEK